MINAQDGAAEPLATDEQIQNRVVDLVGRAIKRQWWMLFLDERDVQLPFLMPIEDYPLVPDAVTGEGSSDFLRNVMREVGATQVIFVWERPTGAGVTPPDREWARVLAAACRERGVRVRAQLISHRAGVRWLAPDDYEQPVAVSARER